MTQPIQKDIRCKKKALQNTTPVIADYVFYFAVFFFYAENNNNQGHLAYT
jgi:hypothetical protein